MSYVYYFRELEAVYVLISSLVRTIYYNILWLKSANHAGI